jgi:hypothetical protein
LEAALRLVYTQENYPWIGKVNKIFLCVKVISSNPELTRQRKTLISCPFQSTDNFTEWKLAFIEGLATGEGPRTWEYIVWVEICLLAWIYFGNYSVKLHDVYVE